ncbi:MAG: dihydrodipicolinate reductase C-terminal domain-containing protein [Alphaproteobacteria bacterium]|nr:dihydrodipicolinate reductase C-terminal domain-containing protein [Alphaproteobacteria bacterium]
MKYAVIGTGKTGQTILDLLPQSDIVAVCNSRNPVTREKVKEADVGVVFVPGKAMGDLFPTLLNLELPLVIGTTGFAWPADLDRQLKEMEVAWMLGQSFSLGLNVMRYYAERVKKSLLALNPQTRIGITEKHHVHKLDAPSGTSIYIAHALGVPKEEIASIREGDVKGTHSVSFDWPYDRVSLTHEAVDRRSFGEGALVACENMPRMKPGLHTFEKLADELIENSLKG